MRLISTVTNGTAAARVYHDNEWQEWRVTLALAGRPQQEATYHTDDKGDALATARVMVGLPPALH